MKNNWRIVTALFLAVSFFACGEDEDMRQEIILGQVGFEGTLPDGSSFGTTDIRSGNGSGGSGVNGKYEGRHILSIRTFDHKWSLSLETPSKPLPDDIPRGEYVPFQKIVDLFNTHYPYEELLNVLLSEKSKADSDLTYTSFSQFRIQLANQEDYYSYLPEFFFPSRGGKIRVLDVEEGVAKNKSGQDVRKIEVVIEFDLPMKTNEPSVEVQEGNLKGVGRFRYREDFYQGELEKFD